MLPMKRVNFAKFFDEFTLAGRGLLLATKKRFFWPPFLITFLVFGTLLNLLSSGFTSFQLIASNLGSGNIAGALQIIGNAFLAIFGVGRNFVDFALNFLLTLLQSILIALVIFVARHNRAVKKAKTETSTKSSSGAESSALVAGLVVLGSGCPTCGTTLLAPALGAVLSGTTGAVRLAGIFSTVLNILAILLAILVFRKLGLETYAIIKSEQYMEKHHEKSC